MELEVLAAIAEVVGGITVLVSLIFVVVSIRQNTTSQKALAVDSLTAAIAAINVPAIESPQVGFAISNASSDWNAASAEDRAITHYYLFSLFKLWENAWFLRQSKVLDEGQWSGWEAMLRKYYHSKGVQEVWWPSRSSAFSPEFQQFLVTTKPPENIGGLTDIFGLP
jgi:hypothetical protein